MSIYDLRKSESRNRKTSSGGIERNVIFVAALVAIVAVVIAVGIVFVGNGGGSETFAGEQTLIPAPPPENGAYSVLDARATGWANSQQATISPTDLVTSTPSPQGTPNAPAAANDNEKSAATAAVPPVVAMAPDSQFIPPVSTLSPPDQALASSAFSSFADSDSVRVTFAFVVTLALGNERQTLSGDGILDIVWGMEGEFPRAGYTFNLMEAGGVLVQNLSLTGVVSGDAIYTQGNGTNLSGEAIQTEWIRISIPDTIDSILEDVITIPGLPLLAGGFDGILEDLGDLDARRFVEAANIARYADAVRLADRDTDTAHFNYEVDLVTWLSNELLTLIATMATITGMDIDMDSLPLEQFLGPMGGGDLSMVMPLLVRSIVTELEAEMDAFASIQTRRLSGLDLTIETLLSQLAVNFLLDGAQAPGPLAIDVDFTANFSNYNDTFTIVEPDEWVEIDLFEEVSPDVLATVVPNGG